MENELELNKLEKVRENVKRSVKMRHKDGNKEVHGS